MISIETKDPLPSGLFEISGVAYRVVECVAVGGAFKSKLESAAILDMERAGAARAANAQRDIASYEWVEER